MRLRVPTLSDLQTVFETLKSRNTEDMCFEIKITNLEIPSDDYSLAWLSFPKNEFQLSFSKVTYKNRNKKLFRKFFTELFRVAPEVSLAHDNSLYGENNAFIERFMKKLHPEHYPDGEDFEVPPFAGAGEGMVGIPDFNTAEQAASFAGMMPPIDFSLDMGRVMERLAITITTSHPTILEEPAAAINAITSAPNPEELEIILRHPLIGTGTDEKDEN